MKRLSTIAVLLLISMVAAAQDNGGIQVSSDQAARGTDARSFRGSTLSSMVAYGSLSLSGEDRWGPLLMIQYTPNPRSMPAIDITGGLMIQSGKSGPVAPGDYVPVQSYFAPYYSPFSNYRNDNAYRTPNLSIGMGFVGTDLTFYLLQGDVRPYFGFGGSLAMWSYSSRLSGTLTPDAKAGLDIRMSNSFSGFAEVRRLVGVPNLFGPDSPRFDGLTSAAVGISFAPRLR